VNLRARGVAMLSLEGRRCLDSRLFRKRLSVDSREAESSDVASISSRIRLSLCHKRDIKNAPTILARKHDGRMNERIVSSLESSAELASSSYRLHDSDFPESSSFSATLIAPTIQVPVEYGAAELGGARRAVK